MAPDDAKVPLAPIHYVLVEPAWQQADMSRTASRPSLLCTASDSSLEALPVQQRWYGSERYCNFENVVPHHRCSQVVFPVEVQRAVGVVDPSSSGHNMEAWLLWICFWGAGEVQHALQEPLSPCIQETAALSLWAETVCEVPAALPARIAVSQCTAITGMCKRVTHQ